MRWARETHRDTGRLARWVLTAEMAEGIIARGLKATGNPVKLLIPPFQSPPESGGVGNRTGKLRGGFSQLREICCYAAVYRLLELARQEEIF